MSGLGHDPIRTAGCSAAMPASFAARSPAQRMARLVKANNSKHAKPNLPPLQPKQPASNHHMRRCNTSRQQASLTLPQVGVERGGEGCGAAEAVGVRLYHLLEEAGNAWQDVGALDAHLQGRGREQGSLGWRGTTSMDRGRVCAAATCPNSSASMRTQAPAKRAHQRHPQPGREQHFHRVCTQSVGRRQT